MTSEIETLKTNEFLRRRKLRLQQVREQSKDIAKKLRLRAQVEKLRHIVEFDEQKENEYLDRQEKIVQQLEQLYAKGKQNTGASHRRAFEERSHVIPPVPPVSEVTAPSKVDVTKLRAREAAAQLRLKKQEQLDSKNRLLQRKLKARDAANVISREKCKSATHSKEPTSVVEGPQIHQSQIPVKGDSSNEPANNLTDEKPHSQVVEVEHLVVKKKPLSSATLDRDTSSSPQCNSTQEENLNCEVDNPTNPTESITCGKNTPQRGTTKNSEKNKVKGTGAVKGRNKMTNQWGNEFLPNEWVPNVPNLKLPDGDKVSTVFINADVPNSKPAKPTDLFAVSEDMPSTLWSKRPYSPPTASLQSKSSLTLVSEYLNQRKLRLRDHDKPGPSQVHDRKDDLRNCKHTIAWVRSGIDEGIHYNNVANYNEGINYEEVCSVHDEQVIPVPTWEPGDSSSPRVRSTSKVLVPDSPNINISGTKVQPQASSSKVKPLEFCGKVIVPPSPKAPPVHRKFIGSGMTNAESNKNLNKIYQPATSKKAPGIRTLSPKGVKPVPSCASSNVVEMHPKGIKQDSCNVISNESSNIIDLPPRPPTPVVRGPSPFRRNKVPKNVSPVHSPKPELTVISLEKDKPKTPRRKKSNVTMYNHVTKDKRVVTGRESPLVRRDHTPEEDAYASAMRQSDDFHVKPRQQRPKADLARSRIASDKQTVEKEYEDTIAFLNSLAREKSSHHRPIKKAYMDCDRQQNFEERHQKKMQDEFRKIEKEAMQNQALKSPAKGSRGRRSKSPSKTTDADALPDDFQYSWMPVPESDASLCVHTIPTAPKDNVRFNKVDCYHEYRSRHKHTPPTRDKHNKRQEPDTCGESEDYSDDSQSSKDYPKERRKKKSTNHDSSGERIIVYKIVDSKRKRDKCRRKSKLSDDHVRSMTSVKNALVKTKKVTVKSQQESLEQLNEGVYKNVAPKGDNFQSLYFPDAPETNLSVDKDGQHQQEQINDMRQMQWDCGDKAADERTTVTESRLSQNKTSHIPPQMSHATYPKASTSRAQTVSTENVQSNTETLATDSVKSGGGFVKLLGDKGKETEKFILNSAGLLDDDGYEVVIQLRKKETRQLKEQEYNLKDNPSQDLEGMTEDASQLMKAGSPKSHLYLEPDLKGIPPVVSQPTHDVEHPIKLQDTQPQPKENASEQKIIEPIRQTACTQTSFHSPSPPTLQMMSSSTSTAYMSPPERILPACLKRNTVTNKSSDSSNSVSKGCKKHCCPHVKTTIEDCHSRKTTNKVSPNATRSEIVVNVEKKRTRKCNCPRCGCDTGNKGKSNKRQSRKCHHTAEKDLPVHKRTIATSKLYKEELNPIIKDYVQRLLALNKDGLKAIEALNNECSSVTTPSSSVINIDTNIENKRSTEAKLSLEHLKNILLQKIEEESNKRNTKVQSHRKKKAVHKIKSLNISKHLLKTKSDIECMSKPSDEARLPSSTSANDYTHQARLETKIWNRSSKQADRIQVMEGKNAEVSASSTSASESIPRPRKNKASKHKTQSKKASSLSPPNPSDASSTDHKAKSCGHAVASPCRNLHNFDKKIPRDLNFMAIAETKVQNMERIANLTEKCTQRLSNLAKVLEEVRKNKSSAFNHVSTGEDSPSESELKTNKTNAFKSLSQGHLSQLNSEAKESHRKSAQSLPAKSFDSSVEGFEIKRVPEMSFDSSKSCYDEDKLESPKEYPSMLEGIPKPGSHVALGKAPSEINNNGDCLKRGKPPPALARIKHGPEEVVPHELSTVVEVDSPMSVKLKSRESHTPENKEVTEQDSGVKEPSEKIATDASKEILPNPDLLQSNVKLIPSTQSGKKSGTSKIEMMDLNKFNEIMLKPFVSIEEFAKQCNVREVDDRSNIGDVPKDLTLNDDMSSMHSEGSLPDVIGELLRRNVITEPFKFDTASNVHSTTLSSESSISVLALSKLNAKENKKPYISIVNREFAESSDALSISSNPDLENAFKKLGMGWASSTLKKTKERLALSSSSSSSSCSQKYMLKAFEKHESSAKPHQHKNSVSVSTLKNAEQQTVHLKGVTVKEFLTQELANKITFNNKSRDETEQEFITLHETIMPEEMKHSMGDDRTGDRSGVNPNRARTSTPVQLFKSLIYHSSSSSNMSNNISNGLFSNVDDLSSVKVTSSSLRNHSTSDKDDLTIPNFSLKVKRNANDVSKSD